MARLTKAQSEVKKPAKTSKHRSPNYPAITLKDAVEFAKLIQAQGADRHYTPINVAIEIWGYKEGWGNQIIAALRAYGLIEVKGKSDKREVKITDEGRRITLDAPEKHELLKAAALKPAIHAELWSRYNADPPADAVIKNYLVVDRFFNRNFVDGFISQFRATIEYAGLEKSDILPDEKAAEIEEIGDPTAFDPETNMTMRESEVKKSDKGETFIPPLRGYLPFPLYLSKSQKATLYVPASLNRKEYELLRKQIEHSLSIMEATLLSDEPEN